MADLTVLVDNQALRGLRAAWGLSILIDDNVLFDTGSSPEVLRHNAKMLGKSLDVEYLVISHQHWDHVGGALAVKYRRAIIPARGEVKGEMHREMFAFEFMKTTGVLPEPVAEHGLIVMGSDKNALLVGCSHPGADNLLRRAIEIAGEIQVVMGGFHLLNATTEQVREIAKVFENNVREVYPIHCTGARAKRILKEELGDMVKEGFAGLKIQL